MSKKEQRTPGIRQDGYVQNYNKSWFDFGDYNDLIEIMAARHFRNELRNFSARDYPLISHISFIRIMYFLSDNRFDHVMDYDYKNSDYLSPCFRIILGDYWATTPENENFFFDVRWTRENTALENALILQPIGERKEKSYPLNSISHKEVADKLVCILKDVVPIFKSLHEEKFNQTTRHCQEMQDNINAYLEK